MLGEMWWILIAEDEIEVREMFRDAIIKKVDSLGMLAHVVEVSDGAEAIGKAASRAFDCIITDLRMPKATGEAMIRAIQEQPLNSNTPVIVISAHAREEFQAFCSEFEHIRYLDKPCTPQQVADTTLKELVYGRRDDRVSVHLLSPFLKAVQLRFGSAATNSVVIQKPSIKKAGIEMAGHAHCLLAIGSEFSKAYFCVSFDNSIFQDEGPTEIANASKEPPIKYNQRVRDLAFELIEIAMPQLKVCLGGNPRLKGLTQVLTSRKEDPNRILLKNATAVTVCVETLKGRIFLSAMSANDFTVLKKNSAA